jgi:hypothetical protein
MFLYACFLCGDDVGFSYLTSPELDGWRRKFRTGKYLQFQISLSTLDLYASHEYANTCLRAKVTANAGVDEPTLLGVGHYFFNGAYAYRLPNGTVLQMERNPYWESTL